MLLVVATALAAFDVAQRPTQSFGASVIPYHPDPKISQALWNSLSVSGISIGMDRSVVHKVLASRHSRANGLSNWQGWDGPSSQIVFDEGRVVCVQGSNLLRKGRRMIAVDFDWFETMSKLDSKVMELIPAKPGDGFGPAFDIYWSQPRISRFLLLKLPKEDGRGDYQIRMA
ncbi:MAG TPA: hypothetical protein VGO93_06065, partial [Candidatus Xenobia bacterium]